MVVIDGMQWAEPTLIELLDDLMQHGDAGPLLLLTMERGVGDVQRRTSRIEAPAETTAELLQLDPLDEPTCDELIRRHSAHAAMPDALRRTIVRAAAGVPLFVEQLLTMLIDDGRLVDDGRGWRVTVAIEDLTVPPTIEALLAARIDALPDDEIAVIEPASVIGREFHAGRRRTTGWHRRSPMRRSSRSIDVSWWPRPRSADSLDDHRFRNLLIRDVVYDGLLKRTRAALHEQFADWLLDGPGPGPRHRVRGDRRPPPRARLPARWRGGRHRRGAGIELGRRAVDSPRKAPATGPSPAATCRPPPTCCNAPRARCTTVAHAAARLLVQAGDAQMETGAFAAAIAHYDEAAQMARDVHDEVTAAAARLARADTRIPHRRRRGRRSGTRHRRRAAARVRRRRRPLRRGALLAAAHVRGDVPLPMGRCGTCGDGDHRVRAPCGRHRARASRAARARPASRCTDRPRSLVRSACATSSSTSPAPTGGRTR